MTEAQSFDVTLIDLHEDFVRAARNRFSDSERVECVRGDLRNVVRDLLASSNDSSSGRSLTAFVAAANSIGEMSGGSDLVYRRLFPGVQAKVRASIRALGNKTALGRHYLTVGSAVVEIASVASTNFCCLEPAR